MLVVRKKVERIGNDHGAERLLERFNVKSTRIALEKLNELLATASVVVGGADKGKVMHKVRGANGITIKVVVMLSDRSLVTIY